jgi:hypothetical protein
MNQTEETKKILAAMDVVERASSLFKSSYSDAQRVKVILPDHYSVKESVNTIHCVSEIGIKKDIDAEGDEHWSYIMSALKNHFREKFLEINHNVCFCHTDFTINLKPVNVS